MAIVAFHGAAPGRTAMAIDSGRRNHGAPRTAHEARRRREGTTCGFLVEHDTSWRLASRSDDRCERDRPRSPLKLATP